MAITNAIADARKKYMNGRGGLGTKDWWVIHPSNDAVLAYCDTEEEADKFIEGLKSLNNK